MNPLARLRDRRSPLPVAWLAIGGIVAIPQFGWGLGSPPTTCAHLCPNLPQNCVVSSNVTVVPGSIIDCGTRDVQVIGGDLTVHDGRFTLKAGTITVSTGHGIFADCPQASTNQGFTLQTTGGITVGAQGRLRADCDAGGGMIALDATGNVTIGGLGIHANGTATNGTGGAIKIWSRGTVSTASGGSATLEARATGTNGKASGGKVEIEATTVTIGDTIVVSGVGHWANGGIVLRAKGDVTVDGVVDASGVNTGDGGEITIEAPNGTVTTTRPMRVRGAGAASTGGNVNVSAQRITTVADVIATGGTDGGGIAFESRGGALALGTAASSDFELNAEGGHGGSGGEIKVESAGNVVDVYGRIKADAGSGSGTGGQIELTGISVTARSGSLVTADGPPTDGGSIQIEARDTMTLSGTLHATNGMSTFVYRTTPPTIGGGVSGPQTQQADASLSAPCGDDVRRDGVEQCDGPDVGVDANGNDKTCKSLGYATGTLDCLDTCQYDTSGCS